MCRAIHPALLIYGRQEWTPAGTGTYRAIVLSSLRIEPFRPPHNRQRASDSVRSFAAFGSPAHAYRAHLCTPRVARSTPGSWRGAGPRRASRQHTAPLHASRHLCGWRTCHPLRGPRARSRAWTGGERISRALRTRPRRSNPMRRTTLRSSRNRGAGVLAARRKALSGSDEQLRAFLCVGAARRELQRAD